MTTVDSFPAEFAKAVDRATAAARDEMVQFLAERLAAARVVQARDTPQAPPNRQEQAAARSGLSRPRAGFKLQPLGSVSPLVTTNPLVRQVTNSLGGTLGEKPPVTDQPVGWSQEDLRLAADKFAATFRENMSL